MKDTALTTVNEIQQINRDMNMVSVRLGLSNAKRLDFSLVVAFDPHDNHLTIRYEQQIQFYIKPVCAICVCVIL